MTHMPLIIMIIITSGLSTSIKMANIKTVEAVRKELYCPHCKFILRDAVQTDNGTRLCQGCFEEILQ